MFQALRIGGCAMSFRRSPVYLRPDEPLLMIIRKHPAVLIRSAILMVTGFIVAEMLYIFTINSSIVVILIWSTFGLLVLNVIMKVFLWWSRYIVATSKWLLLIAGPDNFASLCSDEAISGTRDPSAIGQLLGYTRFEFENVPDYHPLRVIDYVPSYKFEQILEAMSSEAQARIEPGDHIAVDTGKSTLVKPVQRIESNPERLRHLKRRAHVFILITALAAIVAVTVAALVAVTVEPRTQQLAIVYVAIITAAITMIQLFNTLAERNKL